MNAFLDPHRLPYQLPDFANLTLADYEEAFHQGIAEQLADIAVIVGQEAPPTVENTLEALERTGQLLRRVIFAFHTILWSDGTDEVEAMYARLAPKYAAHQDAILMNRALYDRLTQLAVAPDSSDEDDDGERVGADFADSTTTVASKADGERRGGKSISSKMAEASDDERVLEGSPGPTLAETKFLLQTWLKKMRRAGVALEGESAQRLREINEHLTELEAEFGRRLVAGKNAGAVLVTDELELAGIPDDTKATLAAAAHARGDDGWLIDLELPTHQEIVAVLENADLRARIQSAAESRGSHDDETDTREIITEMAALRAEHAKLLGFETHAAYVADGNLIETPEAIEELLGQLAAPALANARREAEALEKVRQELSSARQATQPATLRTATSRSTGSDAGSSASDPAAEPGSDGRSGITASDWTYLAELNRKHELAFDQEQLRPYLELERVLHDGVFLAANKLYGLSFVERPDLAGYLPEVRVFEVFGEGDPQVPNQGRGLVLFDVYTRPTKRGGAWMGLLVEQGHMLGQRPVAVQNLNIPVPAEGEPTLLTFTEVKTLFHEFGHALHGLLSDTHYPSQASPEVPRDFVEYPSQVNETWLLDPEILGSYARHYQTGAPMPGEWADHLRESQQLGEGFALVETLGANAIDQAWHRLRVGEQVAASEVAEFEERALKEAGVLYPPVPPRYRSTYYNHIWASGYSAAYYAYLMSQVYDTDTRAWFAENGGLTRANGEKFRKEVLSRGYSRDPRNSYRALRGRDVIIEPLLEYRGLR
ncbi:MAG: M3 family metallopeptidase [Promicromonosporaceae bacterium]|nr:M3 family metallopeptidase [Promicromonosporaceae bacterium]